MATFLVALVLLPHAADAAEVRARAVFSAKDIVPLEKLDPVRLTCRRGSFRIEVAVDRLKSVEVIGGKRLKLRFIGGGTCTGKIPPLPLTGEWSHGMFKQDWRPLKRLDILRPARENPVDGRRASVKGPKGVSLEGVTLGADSPLEVRKGAFLFKVPWDRIRGLRRGPARTSVEISLLDGKEVTGRPPKILRGKWQGADWSVAGKDLAGITLLGAPKVSARADKSGKSPAETKTLGTAVDDTGVRLTFAAPPVFDGPFSLWDPIRQKRDRTLLPLAGGMFGKGSVTVLISSRAMTGLEREPGGRPGLYRVTLGSGRTFKGTIGKRMLLGRSAGGEFEIPIRRLKKLSLPVRRTVYRTPSETRAEVHLLSGESLTFREPLFFYERKLLPQWQESGLSWTGGHTKPFLFVRFGGTAQRVSFAKLSRLETPTKPGGKFVFVSRDGGRLVLRADFDRHKAFENLMGTDQLHESAEAYALANLGLLGTLAPGVFVHVPWKAIRSVDLDGGGERGNSSAGVMSSTRSAKPSRTNP